MNPADYLTKAVGNGALWRMIMSGSDETTVDQWIVREGGEAMRDLPAFWVRLAV